MFLWLKEIISLSTNPFASMANSSSSSESSRSMAEERLNIGESTGARSPVKREVTVHFDKDNCLVAKVRLVDTRNIFFLPYPKMDNSKEIEGCDRAAYMPKLK